MNAERRTTWPAFAAATVAAVFALVSLYWAAGGMAGMGTLGGEIERLGRARDPELVAATWVAAVLKALGALLALALVRPWGRRLPRRLLLVTAWAGAVVLTVYGVLQTAAVALIYFGVSDDTQELSRGALRWRMLLWEPWFLVWGLLLGLAAWHYGRAGGQPPSSSITSRASRLGATNV